MHHGLLKVLYTAIASAVTFVLLGMPAFALLPATGDGSGSMTPVIYALLGVGVLLVVVYLVFLRKKK